MRLPDRSRPGQRSRAGSLPALSGAALVSVLAGLAATPPAHAVAGQVSGPMQVGPSWGRGDPQHASALLSTIIVNHGNLPDRLIRVDCPAFGQVALRNGTLHQTIAAPTLDQQQAAAAQERDPTGDQPTQNGLDLPPGLHDQPHPVTAQFDLTHATQPVTDGALIPCAVYFAHAGEQVVMFTIGEQPRPTSEP
ncbi:hypothetical protein [Lichenicola sp.]|uniref:hypothetical protein n=1 Tax=Lichenicola sp. TaxID=2804529 RepID=UPI003B003613